MSAGFSKRSRAVDCRQCEPKSSALNARGADHERLIKVPIEASGSYLPPLRGERPAPAAAE
jgi:hypothetical protein